MNAALNIVHQHGFGDLKLNQLRLYFSFGQHPTNHAEQVRILELPGGQIDRYLDGMPGITPGLTLDTGCAQNPLANRHN